MSQTAFPVSDDSVSGWAPTPVWSQINGSGGSVSPTGNPPQGASFKVKLRPLAWPSPGTETLTVCVNGPSGVGVSIVLFQGTTPIAMWTVPASSGCVSFNLTAEQVSAITNYADLHVMVTAGMSLIGAGACCISGQASKIFTVTFSGVTNGSCNQCTQINRVIWLAASNTPCEWIDPTVTCAGFWVLQGLGGGSWTLDWTIVNLVRYTATNPSWDCQSPLTMRLSISNPYCNNLPGTITLVPLGWVAPSSSSSSGSAGPVRVSLVDFVIPNPAPGVPTDPTDPCFGKKILPAPPEGCCAGSCGCVETVDGRSRTRQPQGGCSCCKQPDGCPPACPTAGCYACNPIRYATGEIRLIAEDLKTEGFGVPWGHTRSFANRLTVNTNVGNGFNWQIMQWPYLVFLDSGTVVLMGQANRVLWFDPVGGQYVPRFTTRQSLLLDRGNNVFELVDLDGSVMKFNASTGVFISNTDPAGNQVAVTGYLFNNFNYTEVQRTTTAGGNTTVESYLYTYDNPAAPNPLLTSVLLRRSVNSGSWTNVEQALYTYYADCEPHGGLNDLKTVVTQTWENNGWVTTGTTYYRYWLDVGSSSSSRQCNSSSSATNTYAHLLKYVVNPGAYNRLAAAVPNPLTASDATLGQYADYYFECDGSGRVTREVVRAGTESFSYAAVKSGNAQGYNIWATRTTEILPDGNQNIVYANYAGQTMLKVCQAGADQWLEFYQYDNATADLIMHARPSAVSGYSEQYADLLNNVGGQYQYLKNNAGLIQLYQYHRPTGNLTAELIQQGQLGPHILLRQYQYIAGCTAGASSSSASSQASSSSSSSLSSGSSSSASGVVLPPTYFLSTKIEYPSDGLSSSSSSSSSSSALPQIVTTYSYTWYPGTCQIQQVLTTLPVISAAQNGSGVANTRRDYYDIYANLTWHMDENGFITYTAHDAVTAALTQRIDDVDTTQITAPPGWTAPAAGGLHLITDYSNDPEGRATQVLGPSHTIGGVATTIRRATWMIYQDATFQTWTGQGYATGTSPNYTYTLVNPVSITITDADGKLSDTVRATRASTSGPLQATDSFPQSSYVRWTTQQYSDGYHLSSRRVYKLIPPTGTGVSGTNYDETDFGYNVNFQQNRNVTPGGTITRTVFTARYLPASIWIGTNDNGASESDPTGGGAPGNNMVQVTSHQYDNGLAGGDDNLTQTNQYVDASTGRVTNFTCDWRDRQTDIRGEIDFYQKTYYDNLDRTIQVDRHDTTLAGNLIARMESNFDDLSRVYQSIRYGVDPTTGVVGNGLVDNTWYDPTGKVLMQLPAGSQLFTELTYDGLGRNLMKYTAYTQSALTYAEAQSVANDTVLEQMENTFDAASNLIQVNIRQRYHNATGLGALTSPSGSQPLARVTYVAYYPDALGRVQATADYGTNGGAPLSRPSTIPARSDVTLVTSTLFDSSGNIQSSTDPAGTVTCFSYDAVGREIQRMMNCVQGSSSSSSSSSSGGCPPSLDTNITIQTVYNADGNVAQITALNSQTGNQTTQYIYGTTLASSGVASSLPKAYEVYPDSVGGSDQIAFTYNIQGELASLRDQLGTVHESAYDLLGRKTQDSVTTLGAGVDGSVLCIGTTYEVRGMVQTVTSYSTPCGSQGSSSSSSSGAGIVNQVQLVYNSFAQLVTEYQSHSGPVNASTTPSVQYGYADGSANTVRPTTMTYPNGRVLNYGYGPTGGIDDAASRIDSYIDNDGVTQLVNYSFLGLNNVVLGNSPQPGLEYTLVGIAGGNDPNTGDIYQGLDRFGRVKDLIWLVMGSSSSSSSSSGRGTIIERIQHGYDRASNRLWRGELADSTDLHDELYKNDGLYRLKDLQRGSLTAADTSITNMTFAQCWSLDETGNWSGFRQDTTGSGVWDLVQGRSSNPANEITLVNNMVGSAWATPTYDAAGNMSSLPQPASPVSSYHTVHDAWNRLVSLSAGGSIIATYQFDGVRRRIVTDRYAGAILRETRHSFFSSRWQVLEHRADSSVKPERQFLWGQRFLDDLLLRDRDATSTGRLSERLYALQDPNWNVTGVVSTAGTVTERYGFSAYGTPAFFTPSFGALPSSSYDWETLFGANRWDSDTGLYFPRNRDYAPHLGTWLQRDLLGYLGEASLYLFVGDNPVNRTDPSGLVWGTVAGCAGALVVSGIGNGLFAFLGLKTGCEAFFDTLCDTATGCFIGFVISTFPAWAGCLSGIAAGLLNSGCKALFHEICRQLGDNCPPINWQCLLAEVLFNFLSAGMGCITRLAIVTSPPGGPPATDIEKLAGDLIGGFVGAGVGTGAASILCHKSRGL